MTSGKRARFSYRIEDTRHFGPLAPFADRLGVYVIQVTDPEGVTYDYDYTPDPVYARQKCAALNK